MHGAGSHAEVLLLVKPELSPTDTAAAAPFHILKPSYEVLGGKRGSVYNTVSRFKYSKAELAVCLMMEMRARHYAGTLALGVSSLLTLLILSSTILTCSNKAFVPDRHNQIDE